MSGEQITSLRYDVRNIGVMIVGDNGEMVIEAVELGTMSRKEALEVIVRSWNDLRALFDEVSRLEEDHARMTYTLRQINEKVVDAMQGTARSEIAVDWWQAAGEVHG